MSSVRVIGIKALKNKLSEYVKLASRGETILIADRDEVVAELVPVAPTRSREVADASLAELVRKGVVTPALVAPGKPPEVPPRTARLAELLAELRADRGER